MFKKLSEENKGGALVNSSSIPAELNQQTERFGSYLFPDISESNYVEQLDSTHTCDLRIAVKRTNPENPQEYRYYDVISGVPLEIEGQTVGGGIKIKYMQNSTPEEIKRITMILGRSTPEEIEKYKGLMNQKLARALESERKEEEGMQMLLSQAGQIKFQ